MTLVWNKLDSFRLFINNSVRDQKNIPCKSILYRRKKWIYQWFIDFCLPEVWLKAVNIIDAKLFVWSSRLLKNRILGRIFKENFKSCTKGIDIKESGFRQIFYYKKHSLDQSIHWVYFHWTWPVQNKNIFWLGWIFWNYFFSLWIWILQV